MPQRPTGTVTFMFTDIEGSTKLWEAHPYAMKRNIVHHDALVDGLIVQHGGKVIDHAGDGVFAVFEGGDPLRCALEIQRSLKEAEWDEITELLVRMGMHAGILLKQGDDYRGPLVNRTARITSIAGGGQILLTQEAADVTPLPQGASLKDLGNHRLKDLSRRVQLFQLVHPELPQDFPALQSLLNLPNNLPRQLTNFVGRTAEVAQVKWRLAQAGLSTLTGTGGVGKTRLALQVAAELAEDYPDGVWYVELAPLSEPGLVIQTVAEVLGVADSSGQALQQTLIETLQAKQLLLVLDNCEHLLSACAHLVEALLQSCPQLRVLATSREPLNISGELIWPVNALTQSEAAQLFLERVLAVRPQFQLTPDNAPAVASICERLDGIPLALELAAARVPTLPVAKLAKRLDDRFRLLTGGRRTALPRQQTLKATLDWSYELLSEPEQVLLARLSVFRGGFELEAAEAVCAGGEVEVRDVFDLLMSLVHKSLVEAQEQGDNIRYRLLETMREYGLEKLESARDVVRLQQAHLDHFLALGKIAEPELLGEEQGAWLQRLDLEHDNLRSALEWALSEGKAEMALQLCGALGRFWWVRGHYVEGRAWLEQALQMRGKVATQAQAKALRWQGNLTFAQGDFEAAKDLFNESLGLYRAMGDQQGMAAALNNLGNVVFDQGDYEGGRTLYEESLAIYRDLGDTVGMSGALVNLAGAVRLLGDLEKARALFEESLAIFRELGDQKGIAVALANLGIMANDRGDYEGARALYEESLAIRHELGDKAGMAQALSSLGGVARDQGDLRVARSYSEQSLQINKEIGAKYNLAINLNRLAQIRQAEGDATQATHLLGAGIALLAKIGASFEPNEKRRFEKTSTALKNTLGEDVYAQAFAAGKALSLEQAVELAVNLASASAKRT